MSASNPDRYRILTDGENYTYEIGSWQCSLLGGRYKWRIEHYYPYFKSIDETRRFIRNRHGEAAYIERSAWRPA